MNRTFVIGIMVMSLLTACAGGSPGRGELLQLREEAFSGYRDGRFDEALPAFEELVRQVPGDAELWFRLGNCYGRLGRQEDAATAYQNSLLRDPQNGKVWYNLGLVHLRAALAAYVEMTKHVGPDDPAFGPAAVKREELFQILGTKAAGDSQPVKGRTQERPEDQNRQN